MKTKLFRPAVSIGAILLFASAWFAGLHAQQSGTKPAPPLNPATTNWIGCLVVGQNNNIDPISIGGPEPTVTRQVEIGLRSDGVVVWRKSQATK